MIFIFLKKCILYIIIKFKMTRVSIFLLKLFFLIIILVSLNIFLNLKESIQLTSKKLNLNPEFESLIQRVKYKVNCERIIAKDANEISKSRRILNDLRKNDSIIDLLADRNFIFEKSKCAQFRKIRAYERYSSFTNKKELEFPLAFSILTYENVEQFERLLNSIYRSHNIYCVHIDLKSNIIFRNAIKSITDCFDNVFIATKLEHIIYAGFSRLKADLNCISDLINLDNLIESKKYPNLEAKRGDVKWKYLLNLASTEFPIKTNYELVQILEILNGSNSIYVHKNYNQMNRRVGITWFSDYSRNKMYTHYKKNLAPPFKLKIVKGSAYGVFERNFLQNIFQSKEIKEFIEWLKSTFSPDET